MPDVMVAKALSSELSWKVLGLLTNRELSFTEIRKQLGGPASLIRGQLEKLVDAGIISVREKTASSGKSVRAYGLTRVARNVGFPPRDYLYLSEAMINNLRDSLGEEAAKMLFRDIGVRIGESAGQSLVARTGLTQWDPETYSKQFVAGLLGDLGFQPEVVKSERRGVIYHEHNCLFEDLAVKYPGLVCDILDTAVHEGIDKVTGTCTTRLKCRGHGDAVCEYSVKWDANRRRAQLKARSPAST